MGGRQPLGGFILWHYWKVVPCLRKQVTGGSILPPTPCLSARSLLHVCAEVSSLLSPGRTLPPLAAPLGVLTAHPRGVSFPVMFFCKGILLPLTLRSHLFPETRGSKNMALVWGNSGTSSDF